LRKEDYADADEREETNDALLGAVEEGALDVLHVFDDSGCDLTGLTFIIVADGEFEQAGVEVAAKVDENFLFEGIVDANTKGIEGVTEEVAKGESSDAPDEEVAAVGRDDFIDDPFDDLGDRDKEERAADGEGEGEREESAVAEQVARDASERIFSLSFWQEGPPCAG